MTCVHSPFHVVTMPYHKIVPRVTSPELYLHCLVLRGGGEGGEEGEGRKGGREGGEETRERRRRGMEGSGRETEAELGVGE